MDTEIPQAPETPKNPYADFRDGSGSNNPLTIVVPLDGLSPDVPEELRKEVYAICIEKYAKAMENMEAAAARAAFACVRQDPSGRRPFYDKLRVEPSNASAPAGSVGNPQMSPSKTVGSVAQFSNVYAQRYLDLYQAYIAWEMDQEIPMIPVTPGQMKLYGFTSREIIAMQHACEIYDNIAVSIKKIVGSEGVGAEKSKKRFDKMIAIMTGLDKECTIDHFREQALNPESEIYKILGFKTTNTVKKIKMVSELDAQLKKYNQLAAADPKGFKALNFAHFLMHDFAHLEYDQIHTQLQSVAMMKTGDDKSVTAEERLLMEIRHRIAGDGSIFQSSPGTLGDNPLKYLNMLREGEPGNPEAEFSEKMYFVYMSNHFANAVMEDKPLAFINAWLKKNNKGWQIDPEFVKAMKARGPQYIPPIFRYGPRAALNQKLRTLATPGEQRQVYKKRSNINASEASDPNNPHPILGRALSARELSYQTHGGAREEIGYSTGSALFSLRKKPNAAMSEAARKYIQSVRALRIPVLAGISGTLDQSTTMAGLVGLGIDSDPVVKELELQTIKLAYIAFMVATGDHSLGEILESSQTFGLQYRPGPGFQRDIYPPGGETFIDLLRESLAEHQFPDAYLSEAYVQEVANDLRAGNISKYEDILPRQTSTSTDSYSIENTERGYYFGINCVNNTLGSAIAASIKRESESAKDYDWTPQHNYHLTIGWLETHRCALLLLTEDEVPGKLTAAHAPAIIKMKDGSFNLIIHDAQGVVRRISDLEIKDPDQQLIAMTSPHRSRVANWRTKTNTFFDENYEKQKRGERVLLRWDDKHVQWILDNGHDKTKISRLAELSPAELAKIHEATRPIFEEYQALEFEIQSVVRGAHRENILVNIEEQTKQLEHLQVALKACVQALGLDCTFEFSHQPHILIGYQKEGLPTDANIEDAVAMERLGMPCKVGQVSLMHYDPQAYRQVIDGSFQLGPMVAVAPKPVVGSSTQGAVQRSSVVPTNQPLDSTFAVPKAPKDFLPTYHHTQQQSIVVAPSPDKDEQDKGHKRN